MPKEKKRKGKSITYNQSVFGIWASNFSDDNTNDLHRNKNYKKKNKQETNRTVNIERVGFITAHLSPL